MTLAKLTIVPELGLPGIAMFNPQQVVISKSTAGKGHWLLGFDGLIHQAIVDNSSNQSIDKNAAVDADIYNRTLAKLGRYAVPRRRGEVVFITDVNTATRSLVASAIEVAREAFAVGRLYGYEEIKEDVAYVVYTAVLDDSVCEVCEALDQTQYDDPDEGFEAAPNAECLGGIERCRCYPIAVMRR